MENEIWKDIPNYEGIYQVSNLGRIKSLSRKIRSCHRVYFSKEKILKPCWTDKAYHIVNLCKDKKRKTLKVHQLVAVMFLNHTPCGYDKVVDHIDNNPLNNHVDNLQLISNRQNLSKDKKNKTSKYTGVGWHKASNSWRSRIYIDKKNVLLGNFDNEYDAHLAYQNKLKEIC